MHGRRKSTPSIHLCEDRRICKDNIKPFVIQTQVSVADALHAEVEGRAGCLMRTVFTGNQ